MLASVTERLLRFARKPLSDKWAAAEATFFRADAANRRHLHRLLTGPNAPPRVLRTSEGMYVAYRPDSDVVFGRHPELVSLSEKWTEGNAQNNSGDLPRLYALIFNTKQILDENVVGDMAELGVYRGNSAACLAYYARANGRRLFLFDTFEGFDRRDLVGHDERKAVEFTDTSFGQVRNLVGDEGVTFVRGRFPESVPPEAYSTQFCLVHIDCDLHEPTEAGLEFFYPRLSPGGLGLGPINRVHGGREL